jgi:AcrR family transcriptional regulator
VVLAFRRRKIIDALATVTEAKGYGSTTIADIIGEAKIARTTLYGEFSNKDEIAVTLLEQGLGELFDAVEDACRDREELEAVERGLEAVLVWVSRDPTLARACIVERYEITRADELQSGVMDRFTSMLRTRVPVDDRRPAVTEEIVVGGVEMMLRNRLIAGQGRTVVAALPGLREFVLGPFTRTW